GGGRGWGMGGVGAERVGMRVECPVLFLVICLILFWRQSSAKEYDPGHSHLGSFNGRPKMKKLALIMLAAASLLAAAGLAPAQYYYGGGYYYPAIATVILAGTIGILKVVITVDQAMDMGEMYSGVNHAGNEKS